MSLFTTRRRPSRGAGGEGGENRRAAPREHRPLGWALLILAGCFVVGYLVTWIFFFPGGSRAAIVTVPDLTGLPAAAAERTLEREGLEVERGEPVPNPRIAEGRVLMQTPLPGEEVARGSAVRIVLSSGPDLRTVPSVRGLRREEAVALLQRFGYDVRVTELRDRREAGTLIELRPAPGEPAAVGSTVEVVVSAGPPFVGVPAISGGTVAVARSRLEAVGLALGRVTYDPEATVEWGTVVSQAPAPGDSLRMGSGVQVTVAGTDPDASPPPLSDPGEEEETPGGPEDAREG